MKSHDYHIFMHQILPFCLRGLMSPDVSMTIMRLCRIFRRLCVKTWDPNEYSSLCEDVAVTLSLLEIHFPPSFFDVMTHLTVHLVEELEICGPVTTRWMYPVERYLGVLKRYVRSKARPEGCMAEGYITEEALGFITEYMEEFVPIKTRVWDAEEEEGVSGEVLQERGKVRHLAEWEWNLAHKYVLQNSRCMQFLVREYDHLQDTKQLPPELDLPSWISSTVDRFGAGADIEKEIRCLAYPPAFRCKAYKKIQAYGNHYRVCGAGMEKYNTYDCGVASTFEQDTSGGPRKTAVSYVGVLEEILSLDYGSLDHPVILFKCKWVVADWTSSRPSMKLDRQGFLLVNFSRVLSPSEDPYVFPSQVEQVFFGDVEGSPGWKIVMRKDARSKRIVEETSDIDAWEDTDVVGLRAPVQLETALPVSNLVGAEPLSRRDKMDLLETMRNLDVEEEKEEEEEEEEMEEMEGEFNES
ncbi:hypothetical protein R1sor_012229 [Riccia sorocarpa]|uniref:DUF4218 domain-containing protein n=1 Tax=Riccia sorocarpa TaxID=122646 RepID=A0ABD3I3I8_9MARC